MLLMKVSFQDQSRVTHHIQNNITLVLLLPPLAKCSRGTHQPHDLPQDS